MNNLKDFKNGWVIGDFLPSLVQTKDVEAAVFYLQNGTQGDGHYHKISTEYNIIIKGSAEKDGKKLECGDIFTYLPYEKSYVRYTEDSILLVVKVPSSKNDKFYD